MDTKFTKGDKVMLEDSTCTGTFIEYSRWGDKIIWVGENGANYETPKEKILPAIPPPLQQVQGKEVQTAEEVLKLHTIAYPFVLTGKSEHNILAAMEQFASQFKTPPQEGQELYRLPDGWNVKREELLLPVNGKNEMWDYLTIYDKDGNVLARSTNHHFEGTIRLEYKGLLFMATTPARNYGEEQIFIQVKSLKEKPSHPNSYTVEQKQTNPGP